MKGFLYLIFDFILREMILLLKLGICVDMGRDFWYGKWDNIIFVFIIDLDCVFM